jgi:hypothetical protein
MSYQEKYLKYKGKYLALKMRGGGKERFIVKVEKIAGPELYGDMIVYDKQTPMGYQLFDSDMYSNQKGSIGIYSRHPIDLAPSTFNFSDPLWKEHYTKDIESLLVIISNDAYEKIKKEPEFAKINNIPYSYDAEGKYLPFGKDETNKQTAVANTSQLTTDLLKLTRPLEQAIKNN